MTFIMKTAAHQLLPLQELTGNYYCWCHNGFLIKIHEKKQTHSTLTAANDSEHYDHKLCSKKKLIYQNLNDAKYEVIKYKPADYTQNFLLSCCILCLECRDKLKLHWSTVGAFHLI